MRALGRYEKRYMYTINELSKRLLSILNHPIKKGNIKLRNESSLHCSMPMLTWVVIIFVNTIVPSVSEMLNVDKYNIYPC